MKFWWFYNKSTTIICAVKHDLVANIIHILILNVNETYVTE